MAKDDISQEIEALKEKGITVYSISRLNTFNQCQYEYYLNYIKKNKGNDNCYNLMGGDIHDAIEAWYNNEASKEELLSTLERGYLKLNLLNIKFPSDIIRDGWKADMEHFAKNVKKIDGRFMTEKGFVVNIVDDIYMQGFIDAITTNNNGTLKVIDWKTSGEFKKDKLLKSGRQLVLYKLALEKISEYEVGDVYWFMTKYVFVNYDGKRKMVARRKIVKDISSLIRTMLKKEGYDSFVAEIMLEVAIKNNTLDNMPASVQNRFCIEDCLLEYTVTDELINECKIYIKDTVRQIESMDINDETRWSPCDIDKEYFYCKNLCGHKEQCIHFKNYED